MTQPPIDRPVHRLPIYGRSGEVQPPPFPPDAAAPGTGDREWSTFDFSDCPHNHQVDVEVPDHPWVVRVCSACGIVRRTWCDHVHTIYGERGPAARLGLHEWNQSGTMLRCRACGHDGT